MSDQTMKFPISFDDLLRLHPPRAIHDEMSYRETQQIVDNLTSIPNLSEGQSAYLETLSILMEAYEDKHHPILSPER